MARVLAFLAHTTARLPLKRGSEPLTLVFHINEVIAACGEPILSHLDHAQRTQVLHLSPACDISALLAVPLAVMACSHGCEESGCCTARRNARCSPPLAALPVLCLHAPSCTGLCTFTCHLLICRACAASLQVLKHLGSSRQF